MKRLFILILFFICAKISLSQTYLPIGSPFGNNMARLNVINGFQLPRATDTTLKGSLDTAGMMLYTIPDQTVWLRVLSSGVTNKWVKLTCDFTNYWQLSGNNLYPVSASYNVGIGVIPTHKFDVLDNSSTLYFDAGTLNLEDNPDSINILINSRATNGSNNVYIGNGIGQSGHGNYNTAVGNKALKFGLDIINNTAFGQASLGDANSNNSAAFGFRAGQFSQRDDNVSVGSVTGRDTYLGGNTAIGQNAQNAVTVYTGTIKPAEIQQGSVTYTGTNTATFITNSGLSIGDTSIFFSAFKTAPNAQENPLQALGVVTNSNTITFLNSASFSSGIYDTVTLSFFSKQQNGIALGKDAQTTNSNQFAISPYIDTIYTPGMPSGAGYVLTTDGNNKATWQPPTGSVSGGNAALVTTIPALISFVRDTITTVFVSDVSRGGVFHWKASGSNDNGVNFNANGGGYWERDMTQSQAVNLRWFGATGLGTSSITADTTALRNAITYLRSVNNKYGLYVPEAVDANGLHSFYAFAGNPIYVGDNFKMYGDGKTKSELRNVSPLSTSQQYKGAMFYLGTYGPDTTANPLQAKVHKYSTFPAAINDTLLILQDITKASEMFVGEVIAYGCFKTSKGNDTAKFRMAYWECNQISRINNDTIFFKWPLRINMLTDGLGAPPQIQNINNLAGNANNTGLPNGTCKNVDIGYMMLTQAQSDELADTAVSRQLGVIWQPGNGFNCNFHDLTIEGYLGMGGNMWSHTTWRNITCKSEGKLLDFGYASSDVHIENVDWIFRESPASNFATTIILMNDDVHDAFFNNVTLRGDNFRGTQIISAAGVQGLHMNNINTYFPNYYYDNNIIQIGGDSLRSSTDINITNSSFTVGGAGEFLRIVQNEPSSISDKKISISDVQFHGTLLGYYSSSVFTFTYTVASGETPRRGDTYTTNGSTYASRDNRARSIAPGVYQQTFIRTIGTNDPLSSGTLTKTLGGGATTLSFSAFVIESVSLPYALHLEEQRGVKLYNVSFDTGKLYLKRDTACTLLQVRSTDSLLTTNSSINTLGVTVPATNDYDNGKAVSIFGGVPYANGMPAPIKFTPANSTDATYPNGTLAADNTYFYFRKSNGTWVKIAWITF